MFSKFLELAYRLIILEIEIGLVTPITSEEDKLNLKFGQKETCFKDAEAIVALEILCANLYTHNKTQAAFYRIIAELHGIEYPIKTKLLPKWNEFVNTLMQFLGAYSRFHVAEQTDDFQSYIRKFPEDTMAFCVPIDAEETALDFFLSSENNVLQSLQGVNWVVCSYDLVKVSEAPLLMVFHKSQIKTVFLNEINLQVLRHPIKSASISHARDVDFFRLFSESVAELIT